MPTHVIGQPYSSIIITMFAYNKITIMYCTLFRSSNAS